MHFTDIQSGTDWGKGLYLHDSLGLHLASLNLHCLSTVTHQYFLPYSIIPSSLLYTTIWHSLLKCKSDSIISLLKVIQWLLMTRKISGSHVAKQTYKDVEDADSYVSCTISSFPFLLVAQVSSAWLTCSSVNTLFLPATTLSHLYLPVLAPRGDAARLSSLPTPISQLPAPFLHLPFKTQLKHSLPFLSRLSWLLQPELSPPSYVPHSILFSISTTSFITFLKFILIMHCLLR